MAKLRLVHFKLCRNAEEAPGQLQVQQIVRLRIKSGAATSGPPIGPVLGQYAIPISKFCTEFNDRTLEFFKSGVDIFVTLYYMVDGSYNFDLGLPISSICFRRGVRIRISTGNPPGKHKFDMRRGRNWRMFGAMSQYMLYEILAYITEWSGNVDNSSMRSMYDKCIGTLRSMGIIMYTYRSRFLIRKKK